MMSMTTTTMIDERGVSGQKQKLKKKVSGFYLSRHNGFHELATQQFLKDLTNNFLSFFPCALHASTCSNPKEPQWCL